MQTRKVNKVVNSTLNQEDIKELREAFQLFDRKNTGKINILELKQTMETLGFADRNPMIHEMVGNLEKNKAAKNEGISFDTFINAFNYKLGDFSSREGLRRLFELFNDDPKAETITLETMKKIRDSFTETNLKDVDICDIISRISKNGENEMSFEDFYHYMTRKTYA